MKVSIRYLGDSNYNRFLTKPSCIKIRKLGEVLKNKTRSKPLKEVKSNRKAFRIWLDNELISNIVFLIEKENLSSLLPKDIIPTICLYALNNSSIVTGILKDINKNNFYNQQLKKNP